MWQVDVDGRRNVFRSKEELLCYLYSTRWNHTRVACMECGEVLETEDEVRVFSFIDRHDGHFGTMVDLNGPGLFESLEAIGGEEV